MLSTFLLSIVISTIVIIAGNITIQLWDPSRFSSVFGNMQSRASGNCQKRSRAWVVASAAAAESETTESKYNRQMCTARYFFFHIHGYEKKCTYSRSLNGYCIHRDNPRRFLRKANFTTQLDLVPLLNNVMRLSDYNNYHYYMR